MSAQEAIQ